MFPVQPKKPYEEELEADGIKVEKIRQIGPSGDVYEYPTKKAAMDAEEVFDKE